MKALLIAVVIALVAMCSPAEQLPDGVCLYSTEGKCISVGDQADSASVAEVFGEPRRVVRFTDDKALCGEVERIVYDSMTVGLLDGIVYEFEARYEGARMSVNGDVIEVGMAHADLKIDTESEYCYNQERDGEPAHFEITDGVHTKESQLYIVNDCLVYTIEDERITSIQWQTANYNESRAL